jgi:CBS domain-containing protein
VYDYVAGKADWLAAGLPSEGKAQHDRVLPASDRDPPTCLPDASAAVVARRLTGERQSCAVVDANGVVVGRLHADAAEGNALVEHLMEPGPSTIRADADLDETLVHMRKRHIDSLLVTTPDGVLLGELLRPPDA